MSLKDWFNEEWVDIGRKKKGGGHPSCGRKKASTKRKGYPKCRKSKGQVRKSTAGSSLKRWGAEKWKDTRTGKPCGQGGKNEYCRPTKRVSSKTPKTKSEMSKSQLKRKKAEKSKVGMGRRVKPVRRKK